MTPPLRLGAVTYLNARPLTRFLAAEVPEAVIEYDAPSRLADRLLAGELDIALIPSIECARNAELRVVSDACVACEGSVRSVRLFGREPPARIRSLALDAGSRTSAALAQVILREQYGMTPQLVGLPLGADYEQTSADAILVIGDRGLVEPNGQFAFVWDLGERWAEWQRLPFVFAVWAARPGIEVRRLSARLATARDRAIARLDDVAREEVPGLPLDEAARLAYLRENLSFILGPRQRQGLERFLQLASKYGLAPHGVQRDATGATETVPVVPAQPTAGPVDHLPDGENATRALAGLASKAARGARLSVDEALALLESNNLPMLGRAADAVARRLHPGLTRTYHIDRNINYTNLCTGECRFCAFSRRPGDAQGYVIEREELYRKIRETIALGGDQILLQGGMNPALGLEWYESILSDVKSRFPDVNIHGLSPPEIWHVAEQSGMDLGTVLARLRAAGLGSLPGGGAEILVDRVRRLVSPCKCSTEQWLAVCRAWHHLGGKGSATMMFGHVETLADRIEHLDRLRTLQDETGGFTAFIGWTFQPGCTALADLPKHHAHDYLKTLAVARLFLDNFPNVQASWVTQGLDIGQLALRFGANDFGSLMIEENVVAAAGTRFRTTEKELRRRIAQLGFQPARRDGFYRLLDETR